MDSKEVRTLMEAYASVYFDETMMGESMVRGSNPIPGKTLPQSTPTSNPAPAPTPAKPQLSQRSQAILSGNSPLSRDPRARGGFDPRFDKKPSAPSTPSTSSFAPKPPTPSTPTSTPSTSSSAPKPPTPSTPTSAPKPGGGGGLFGSLDKFARDSAGKLGGEVGAKKGRETAGNIFGIPEKIGRDRGTKKGQEMYDRAKETLGGFLKQDYEPDVFDIILEYLVAEGYADTNENALVIMANMGEEWRQSIVEGFPATPLRPRPGDAGTSGLKLIRTPDGKTGYTNKHAGGEMLPSGTVNKIMSGDLMVKDIKKNTNSNLA